MKTRAPYTNLSYFEFNKYKHEIYLDVKENLLKMNKDYIKDAILELGENDIHYLVNYHIQVYITSLYFNNKKILYDYNKWLYRVYFYRKINFEFFKYLNRAIGIFSKFYLEDKAFAHINDFVDYTLSCHDEFKDNSSVKQVLIEFEDEATEFSTLLLEKDTELVLNYIEKKVQDLDSFILFYSNIVASAMKKIGFMWETTEISVAKEHRASKILQETLEIILERFNKNPSKTKTIFIAVSPTESHNITLHITKKVLNILGYTVIQLDLKVSASEIKSLFDKYNPTCIILTATLITSLINIVNINQELSDLKKYNKNSFKIFVAGNAFENLNLPAKSTNADVYVKDFYSLLEHLGN